MMFESDFSGKVAIVTGGVSGIGEACTLRLAELGAACVVAIDRDAQKAAEFTDRHARAANIRVAEVDITHREELDSTVEAISKEFGRLDVLLNCAGVFTPNTPAEKAPAVDFRTNFEVNVLGTVQACQASYPLLAADGGGAVVNIASQAALVSLPEQSAYTASKGAVAALTRSLAIDWAPRNVRVNAVCPGFTRTPMNEGIITPELQRAVERRVPLGRLFAPSEMANAILFLASSLASAITGVVLAVDGGWTAGEAELPQW